MSINGGMDKEDVVFMYIQCNITQPYKRKEKNAICRDMDGPRDCHTE